MKISKDKYYKDMARALLKGYFAGLKEGERREERFTTREVERRSPRCQAKLL